MSKSKKTYDLKIDLYKDLGDIILLYGNNFLRETCTDCGKSKTFLVTGGYIFKAMMDNGKE